MSQVISSEVLSSFSASILDALKDGACTEQRLAEQLQISRNSVRRATRRLEELSLVEKIRHEGSMLAPLWKLKT
ncbi:GntR family transcriptional regulator [Vibrio parahaemolyticus]|uniref:GntR family transcriptional regulator n=1 Tax=Vibrio parahaemolyticus TaxID=670 RepID=UPI00209B51E1|nr:GntR family transcriptional regulator [Vibrio parahaemolyticus]